MQLCIQRILGRDVYGDREKIAWSTAIATQGATAFIDALLHSEEHEQRFGDSVVPYQQRRILSQQAQGNLPFVRMARSTDRSAQIRTKGLFVTSGNRAVSQSSQFLSR